MQASKRHNIDYNCTTNHCNAGLNGKQQFCLMLYLLTYDLYFISKYINGISLYNVTEKVSSFVVCNVENTTGYHNAIGFQYPKNFVMIIKMLCL